MKAGKFLSLLVFSLLGLSAFGQNITGTLLDDSDGSGLGFATVSITKDNASKPAKYILSNDKGKFTLESVKNGTYTLKAELMGYVAYTKKITIKDKDLDLGEIKMKVDSEQLDAASVSALSNPVTIKKDTIEYNASSFKTTDNDVLEDLLKKLPGVEVSDSGSITVNGESVNKITIDGKTFFLDDPQIASKNIPAKLVNKLKVIKKKSEQAEFTGIDDGEEETVIDLSVQPGMMKGLFGNVNVGGGADVPSQEGIKAEARYAGNAFIGRFSDNTQISLILNANNSNGGGATNMSGNMMGNMRGGGGGMGQGGGFGASNGITTSYMGGLNAAGTAFDGNMEVGGNYFYNHGSTDVEETSSKLTYLKELTGNDLLYNSKGTSNTTSGGHRFGMRLEHKFSDNTSILFEPQVNFGTGSFMQVSNDTTYNDSASLNNKLSEAYTNNIGSNKNLSTSGFFLFRQRLGIPGRTITANIDYNYSNNQLAETDDNGTNNFSNGEQTSTSRVYQQVDNTANNFSINGRLTYTEPLGNSFYLQANYSYSYSKSTSEKNTFDLLTQTKSEDYSNNILNVNRRQEIGINALYQNSKYHAQVGFSAMPNYTLNSTVQGSTENKYEDNRWNFSPQVMLFAEPNDNLNLRFFYRGESSQPSTSQLMPVPDNTNPLRISFGNPHLTPYFNNNINGDVRFSNARTATSLNVRFNGGFTQNPIVNTTWYGTNGGSYTMPFNGKTTANAGLNMFANFPLGRSYFTMSGSVGANWSMSGSYVGSDIDMSTYETDGFYAFMEEFYSNFNDASFYKNHISENTMNNLSTNARARVTYNGSALQASLSASTRINNSWYKYVGVSNESQKTMTLNNSVSADLTWNWEATGIGLRLDANYNWYGGYTTEQPAQCLVNMQLTKLAFNNNVTFSLRGYDILGQSKNLMVSDNDNYHSEVVNNTLGRYIIFSAAFRFGTIGNRRGSRGGMGGGMRGMGGMGGGMRGPM